MLGLLALAAAACSDDGDGDGASTTIASTAVPTSLLTTPPTVTPPVTIGPAPVADAAALVEDCVAYVPTAIYFGNFYMKAIWDLGGGTPEGLRQVCEGMVTSDPDGLRRMSAEYADLQNLAASATTAAP
jgi:hypothetical protein